MFFLTAESADERLEAVINRSPSLDNRNPPLSRTDCQRDWINEFSSSASNRTATWRRLFTRIRKPSLQAKRASISSMRTETENRWQVLAQDTIPAICSRLKLQPKESGGSYIGSLTRCLSVAGNDPDVSYIRFNSRHSLNENESAVKRGLTRRAQSVSSPLTMWRFISWQFRQTALLQSMYRWLFMKSST